MAIMLITHDLGRHRRDGRRRRRHVRRQDRRAAGRHDGLRAAAPPVHEGPAGARSRAWASGASAWRSIQGVVPNPLNLPTGCLFKRRCPYAMPICDTPPAAPGDRAAVTSRAAGSRRPASRRRSASRARRRPTRPRPRSPWSVSGSRADRRRVPRTCRRAAAAAARRRRPPLGGEAAPAGRQPRQALRDPRRPPRDPKIGAVRAVDGVSLRRPQRRDARPGRRVRLRQDHPRQGHPPPDPGDLGRVT